MKQLALRILIPVLVPVLLAAGAGAQSSNEAPKPESKPASVQTPRAPQATRVSYRLDFTFSELDGNKKINSRSYSVTCEDMGGRWAGYLRVGSRVPVATNAEKSQFNYQDIGVNIDAVIEPAESRARIITALRSLETKRDTNPKKKHGNIPL